MERNFKFRAWDKERKEMLAVKVMDFSQWWVSCDPFYGQSEPPLAYGERNSFRNEETDRHILMQYTGLKDKNGTEIYEGDIIKVRSYSPHTIIFVDGMFGSDVYSDFEPLQRYGSDIEVIGNIYENPELLGG